MTVLFEVYKIYYGKGKNDFFLIFFFFYCYYGEH